MASRDDDYRKTERRAVEFELAHDGLTPLDWGAAGFFKRASDVINKQITDWILVLQSIGASPDNDEIEVQSAEKIFVHNLSAGWTELCAGKDEVPYPSEKVVAISGIAKATNIEYRAAAADLARELTVSRDAARDLFNFYYYIAFDSYGEQGEYYFIPLSLPLPGARAPTEKRFQEWLGKSDPTRNIGKRRYQYAGTPSLVAEWSELVLARQILIDGCSCSRSYNLIPNLEGTLATRALPTSLRRAHVLRGSPSSRSTSVALI